MESGTAPPGQPMPAETARAIRLLERALGLDADKGAIRARIEELADRVEDGGNIACSHCGAPAHAVLDTWLEAFQAGPHPPWTCTTCDRIGFIVRGEA